MVKHCTIRVVLSLTTIYNWPLGQVDLKCAFFNGELTEIFYMVKLEGFELSEEPRHVYKLKKTP